MQPGRARTSGFGVPLLPLARWVGWVAPVRPTHGVLVLSCPSAALRVCSVLGRWAPVHRCARAVCCGASAVSWASWLLFTGVPARCVVLHVRRPGPLGSCLPVCVPCAVRVCHGWMCPSSSPPNVRFFFFFVFFFFLKKEKGESSEELDKEAFQRTDVQLDLSMHTAGVPEGWSLRDYRDEYKCVLNSLSDGLEAHMIGRDRWYKDNQYLYYEDRIVVPEARLQRCLQWAHLSSWSTGCNRSVDFLVERFYAQLTCAELRARMQSIVESCGCHATKQSDSRDRGLVSSLPIPYCAKSLLYVDFIHGLPKFGSYDSCLVVTCGLTCFTRAFPCNKKITGEQTVKTFVEQWFEHYGAPKEVHSDEDVRIRSDTGRYKRVLDPMNVHVTTGVPYTHTSNPLCERWNRVLEDNLRIVMKQERTKDWVRLLPWAVLTMTSQESSSIGYTPHELFHGWRPAWFFKTPFPEDYKSPIGDWLEQRHVLANLARANLQHVRERELTRRNRTRRPATFEVGDLVLVHRSRLPT